MEAQKKRKTGGRRKGAPNKVTATARENIMAVFTRLGGVDAMAEWASENQTEFYKLYARLIPAQAQLDEFNLERVIEDPWAKPFRPLPPSLAHLETIVGECTVE
jgi:hypothetical protein